MKRVILISAAIIIAGNLSFGQGGTAINPTGAPADNSAILDANSSTQGQLLPRMTTTQRNAIVSPANSLLIFNTDCNCFQTCLNGQWQNVYCDLGCSTPPSTPGAISGNSTPCQNSTAIIYTISQVAGATSYIWTVPAGAAIIAGQGTTGIVVNYGTSSGSIIVKAANSCGVSSAQNLTITLAAGPPAAGSISGTPSVCLNSSGISYSVAPISGATSYVWSYSGQGFSIASGSGTNSINADYSGSATSGILTVYGAGNCGNGSVSPDYSVSVNGAPSTPTANSATNITTTTFTANWNTVSGATTYYLDVATDAGFTSYVSGYNNLNAGNVTSNNVTGLTCNTTYFYRVRAYSSCGTSGSSTTVSPTTSSCWSCGSSLQISHVASGGVAPVDKTVTYGTVTNVPGETSKCWITQNLGATNQASSSGDATEDAAGWYWQFNRKQGYKHDGATRTPGTTWLTTTDNSSSTWESSKDPCTLELGSGWRVPTNTEWTNVDASGGWTNATTAYNSLLKLHMGGQLDPSTGDLGYRGSNSNWWTYLQSSSTQGYLLWVSPSTSQVTSNTSKAYGISLRCIKN